MAFINTVVGRAAASIWGLKLGNATTNAVLAQVNALGANDAAVAAVVNSAFNSVYGSYSNADLAAAFANNLGLTGTARDDGIAYTVAQLDGVSADARGGSLLDIATLFSGLTGDATYGNFARSFNAKVDAAVDYAAQTGTVDSPMAGWDGNSWFTLSGLQDYVVGTPGDDIINAYEFNGASTLQSGDFVDGGAGNDLLYADVINEFDAVTPITRNVESIAFRAQDNGSSSGGNNTSGENITTIDAERIDGENRYESNNSRADLIIEDVRIAASQITKNITIAMVETDPGNVDFGVYFDQPSLRASATASASLELRVLDQFGVQTDPTKPLLDNPYDGVRFTYSGRDVQLRDPTLDLRNGENYADFLTILQALLAQEPITNGTSGLAPVTAALGPTFKVTASNGVEVTGTSVILSALGAGVSFAPGTWIASGGVPADSSVYTGQFVSSGVSNDLITSTIILDAVGRGSNGGDLLVGGLSVGETSTSKGVEKFDITVERTSRLQQIESTNDTLKEVVLKNGLSTGDVYVNGSTGGDNQNALPGATSHNDAYGFNDVRLIDGSTMSGKVNFTALVSQKSFNKYVLTTDTQGDPAGDNGSQTGQTVQRADFVYSGGSNADTMRVRVESSTASSHSTVIAGREDFSFKVNGNGGNDSINFRVIDSTNSGTLGQWYSQQHAFVTNNVTIDAGTGDDTVRTPGAGDMNIWLGDGADTVYADNSGGLVLAAGANAITNANADANFGGEFAMFVFNTADQVAVATRERNDLSSGPNISYDGVAGAPYDSLHRATITVTYLGLTATALLPTGVFRPTTLHVNQAVKAAINGNAVLSKLLVAQDGPGYSLVVKSLIDGVHVAADLDVSATAFDSGTLSLAQQQELWLALGNVGAVVPAALQGLLTTGEANFNADASYNSALATAGGAEMTGAGSVTPSDNIIQPGTGNDVIVLGTTEDGATELGSSNDIVVYSPAFGNDTIVRFAADGAGVFGADVLDLTALGGDGGVALDSVNAAAGGVGSLGNVVEGEITIRQFGTNVDTAAEVAGLYTDSGAVASVAGLFIAVTAGNVGQVWQIVDPAGVSDVTAVLAGSIDLAATDWFTLTGPNFG
jgi:hypothetical protein